MPKARLWFARAVMLYAASIFTFLGLLFFITPERAGVFDVTLAGTPQSLAFVRVVVSGLFLGMAFFAAYGLAVQSRLLDCLWVIVILNAFVLVGRLYGMAFDGVTPLVMRELRDEGVSWLVFVAALVLYPRPAKTA